LKAEVKDKCKRSTDDMETLKRPRDEFATSTKQNYETETPNQYDQSMYGLQQFKMIIFTQSDKGTVETGCIQFSLKVKQKKF
jgi:hypothetical protein